MTLEALSDSVVTLRPPGPGDARLLIAGRDAEFFRWIGPGAEVPDPVACVWVDDELVGWFDYDVDHDWLKPGEVNVGYYLFPAARGCGYASRAMRLVLGCLLAVLSAGCGGSSGKHLATSTDGRAVIHDAYDNQHLDRDWSCGSLRAAVRRLAADGYSAITVMIDDATGRACDQALAQVRVGLKPERARAILGVPDRTPRCWLYSWPVHKSSSSDGARICFVDGQVGRVQFSEHL